MYFNTIGISTPVDKMQKRKGNSKPRYSARIPPIIGPIIQPIANVTSACAIFYSFVDWYMIGISEIRKLNNIP